MNKKAGLLLLILGLAVMVFVLIDPTGLHTTPEGQAMQVVGPFGEWPPLRIGLMAAGALVGVLGAYSLVKKAPVKK